MLETKRVGGNYKVMVLAIFNMLVINIQSLLVVVKRHQYPKDVINTEIQARTSRKRYRL